jgi:hypothetical protein
MSCVRNYPLIEAVIVIVLITLYYNVWRHVDSREVDIGKRSLGATVVIGQLNGLITSGSLTLALIGAINAGLFASSTNFSVKHHAFLAMILVFLSIISSLFSYSLMNRYIIDHNVARQRTIVISTAISLGLFAMGLLRLILAVSGYVWR